MDNRKRRDRLSVDDKKFIAENCTDPKWTDAALAKHLGRNIRTIIKARKSFGVLKGNKGIISVVPQDKKAAINDNSINKANLTDEEKVAAWRRYFMKQPRYTRLKTQMSLEDLEYYTHKWAEYHLQFEDIKPTEEDTLDTMITLQMRMDDNRRDYKAAQQQELELREKLGNRDIQELDLEKEEDRWIYEFSMAISRQKADINKDYQMLHARYESAQKAMSATREQREAKQQIGADTFLSLVRQFKEEGVRREAGLYNERFRLAVDKKKEEFSKAHAFDDTTIEPVLMVGKKRENKDGR